MNELGWKNNGNGGGGGSVNIYRSLDIYIDTVYGDDTTAEIGNFAKPYKTSTNVLSDLNNYLASNSINNVYIHVSGLDNDSFSFNTSVLTNAGNLNFYFNIYNKINITIDYSSINTQKFSFVFTPETNKIQAEGFDYFTNVNINFVNVNSFETNINFNNISFNLNLNGQINTNHVLSVFVKDVNFGNSYIYDGATYSDIKKYFYINNSQNIYIEEYLNNITYFENLYAENCQNITYYNEFNDSLSIDYSSPGITMEHIITNTKDFKYDSILEYIEIMDIRNSSVIIPEKIICSTFNSQNSDIIRSETFKLESVKYPFVILKEFNISNTKLTYKHMGFNPPNLMSPEIIFYGNIKSKILNSYIELGLNYFLFDEGEINIFNSSVNNLLYPQKEVNYVIKISDIDDKDINGTVLNNSFNVPLGRAIRVNADIRNSNLYFLVSDDFQQTPPNKYFMIFQDMWEENRYTGYIDIRNTSMIFNNLLNIYNDNLITFTFSEFFSPLVRLYDFNTNGFVNNTLNLYRFIGESIHCVRIIDGNVPNNVNIRKEDYLIYVARPITIMLPDLTGTNFNNKTYTIKNINTSEPITIQATGGIQIDGVSSYNLLPNESITLQYVDYLNKYLIINKF
ncbi:MAG: hypothetical protein KatS3mg096_609 [Candidatus Parcubacteria bacterium]|nr:MAG: hypothetical protein KatS3mg096_609 [Candidatus Parcubacteria bacterium]